MAQRTAKEIERERGKFRRQVRGRCEACNKEIIGVATRRYCGNACRVKASRARRHSQLETSDALPPLIVRLNEVAERLAQGRTFPDSTPLIDQLRDERMAEL